MMYKYTMTQLFGWYDGEKAADRLINCQICGAVVSYDNRIMNIHQEWHNALAANSPG